MSKLLVKDFAGRQIDQLMRLARFKPKYVRMCQCKYSHHTCMKWHFIYRCSECGGKKLPENTPREIVQ